MRLRPYRIKYVCVRGLVKTVVSCHVVVRN